jgi:succinate dehydrogenase/fumarate reductase-like Fe-S protein
MWAIDEEFAILHQGKHNETLNGSKEGMLYTMWARCRDTWHIEAIDSTRFYVLLDEQKPIIIRMYHDITVGDYLIIETDEESECVYGTSDTIKCAYNFSDGSAFTTSDMYLHAAYWQLSSLYYIKCKDKWNNYPGKSSNANQCTAVINPYEVPIM